VWPEMFVPPPPLEVFSQTRRRCANRRCQTQERRAVFLMWTMSKCWCVPLWLRRGDLCSCGWGSRVIGDTYVARVRKAKKGYTSRRNARTQYTRVFISQRLGSAEENEMGPFKKMSQKFYTQFQATRLFSILGVYTNASRGCDVCKVRLIIRVCIVPPPGYAINTHTWSELLEVKDVSHRGRKMPSVCHGGP
jgi:hypothetical protein